MSPRNRQRSLLPLPLSRLGATCRSTSRENRFDLTASCSRDYAFEELVAEITACMAMHHVGIEPDHEGMASYVKGWASRLRDEPGTLMKAMGKAQKAFDRMTGWSYKEEEVAA